MNLSEAYYEQKFEEVLRTTFWHSVIFATFIGLVACAQAYVVPWMIP